MQVIYPTKNLSTIGQISVLVIQALREIGKENVTNKQLEKIELI